MGGGAIPTLSDQPSIAAGRRRPHRRRRLSPRRRPLVPQRRRGEGGVRAGGGGGSSSSQVPTRREVRERRARGASERTTWGRSACGARGTIPDGGGQGGGGTHTVSRRACLRRARGHAPSGGSRWEVRGLRSGAPTSVLTPTSGENERIVNRLRPPRQGPPQHLVSRESQSSADAVGLAD